MGMFDGLLKKIKRYFGWEEIRKENGGPNIEIREQNNTHFGQDVPSLDNTPRIVIGEVHWRSPILSEESVHQGEANVQSSNLGHGITVKKQRKPSRCPLCATRGKVVMNVVGGDKWKCEECGSTFN